MMLSDDDDSDRSPDALLNDAAIAHGVNSTRLFALVGPLLAAPSVYLMRNFTVDDAWIPARYAAHLSSGLGYRFNPQSAVSDGVTPLPFAPLLSAMSLGSHQIEVVWWVARLTGVVCWLCSAALLSLLVSRLGFQRIRFVSLVILLGSAPLAAWSIAGLETPIATLFVTAAIWFVCTKPHSLLAPLLMGGASTFRPELIVASVACALSSADLRPLAAGSKETIVSSWKSLIIRLFAATSFWALIVVVREIVFGRPVPLSLLAKPSDFTHGFAYAVLAFGFSGAAWLALGGSPSRSSRVLWSMVIAHLIAVLITGGDWMPFWRLWVPLTPAWIILGAISLENGRLWTNALRVVLCSASLVVPWVTTGPSAMGVVPVRQRLIDQRDVLSASRVIAVLDVGWVSACRDVELVDLAGVTDPAIAVLPGGHTSKKIAATLLARRDVDTLVFLQKRSVTMGAERARDDGGPYDRVVEEMLAHDPWITEHFEPQTTMAAGPLTYVVWRPIVSR